MTREKYESLPLATLRELAKARKMKGISTLKKGDLIEAMLAQDDKEKQEEANAQAKEEVKEKKEGTDIEQLDSGRIWTVWLSMRKILPSTKTVKNRAFRKQC